MFCEADAPELPEVGLLVRDFRVGGRVDFSDDRSAAVRWEAPVVTKLKDILLFDELPGGAKAAVEIIFLLPFLRFLSFFFFFFYPQPIYAPPSGKKKGCEALSRRAPCKEAIKSFAL